MHRTPRGVLFAPENPIARVLAAIVGLAILAVVFSLSVIFFAAFAALGAVAWLVFSVRRWWLTRGGREQHDPDIVDVEYRVVHTRSRRDDPS